MTALISWLFRLIHGDLYSGARHRMTAASSVVYLGTRQGWRYRRPEYRWMDVTALWTQVKLRDITVQRSVRW